MIDASLPSRHWNGSARAHRASLRPAQAMPNRKGRLKAALIRSGMRPVERLRADQPASFALALAARFLPASFLACVRAPMVLPRLVDTFLRGAARRAFFFLVSTLRAERAPRAAAMTNSSGGNFTSASI